MYISGEPLDKHKTEIEKVEIMMRSTTGEWVKMPVAMDKVELDNGLIGFYGRCPSVRIPKPIPEGLPFKKYVEMEYDRSINMCFSLREGCLQHEQYGKIQVNLIPLQNRDGYAGIVLPLFDTLSFDRNNCNLEE